MIETEYPITLCQACSASKKALSLGDSKCPFNGIPFSSHSLPDKIFFNFEAFMKTFPEKASDARCDVLYRSGRETFLFIELKVADWFFETNDNKEIIGQKNVHYLFSSLKLKFENSFNTYLLKYPPIPKNICFSIMLSNGYFNQKWNTPSISISMLKDIIRKKVFRMFSKDYMKTKSYTYKGIQVKLDARDCDEADKLISLA